MTTTRTIQDKPVRLTLSRAKGFDLQKASAKANGREAVVVARPSRWGNPFPVSQWRAAPDAVAMFRRALREGELPYSVTKVRTELRGKNLACWCKPGAPCHADVLLELANT